ncbi:MAG: ABC transporter permease [Caldilineaceae bacterium]
MESARYLVLPVLTLVLGLLAQITLHTRNSLIAVLRSDYLRTAVSKGMPKRVVIVRHALRNALLPTISVVALNVGWLLSGVVLVESVFAYPGLGRLMLQAINSRDIPVLQAVALVAAALYALSNLAADLLYRWLNPRIHYS